MRLRHCLSLRLRNASFAIMVIATLCSQACNIVAQQTEQFGDSSKTVRTTAEAGDAKAQFSLGMQYFMGIGVPEDSKAAATWFLKAAEQGNADAQNALGAMYEAGEGVSEDKVESTRWFRKAAEQGYAAAQFKIGNHYLAGIGVSQNFNEAEKWYRKSAEGGYPDAEYALGLFYKTGFHVPKDLPQAISWFQKAADGGNADAKSALKDISIVAASQQGELQLDPKTIATYLEKQYEACPRRELVAAFPRKFHKQVWQKAGWGPPTQVFADVKANDSLLYPFMITVEFYLSFIYGPERQSKAEAESDTDLAPLNVPLPTMRGAKYRNTYLVGKDGLRLKSTESLETQLDGTAVAWKARPLWPDACWDQIH